MTAIKHYTYNDPHADAKRHDDNERRADWGLQVPPRQTAEDIERELARDGYFWYSVPGAGARLVSAEEYALWFNGGSSNVL